MEQIGGVDVISQADLQKAVDSFVEKNKANGELNKLYQKWLGTDFPVMPS